MKIKLLLGILTLLIYSPTLGQRITLNLDYGNADQTLEYLETDIPDETSKARLLVLEGTQGLIQKNGLNDTSIIQSLNNFDKGMQYDFISNNKDDLKAFLRKIKSEEDQIRERVLKTLLNMYLRMQVILK